MTISELKSTVECLKSGGTWEMLPPPAPGLPEVFRGIRDHLDWVDGKEEIDMGLFDEEPTEEVRDLLNMSWKASDDWEGKKRIKVESVVDSGAAAPRRASSRPRGAVARAPPASAALRGGRRRQRRGGGGGA